MPKKYTRRIKKVSTSGEWLVGNYVTEFNGSKLPTKREVLSFFLYQHFVNKNTISVSADLTTEAVIDVWQSNQMSHQQDVHIKKQIKSLHIKWQKLKKNRLRNTKTQNDNEIEFMKMLEKLFNIECQAAVNKLKPKTREVLPPSQQSQSSSGNSNAPLSSQKSTLSSMSSSSDDFCPPSQSKKLKLEPKIDISHPRLSATLDRTQTTNRNAVLLVSAAAASLGHDVKQIKINRETIRQTRNSHRIQKAKEIKNDFKPNIPLTVHWDSKFITNGSSIESSDRLAVIVSGVGVTKILGIPKIESSTGIDQANAVYDLIVQWNLVNNIKSMGFDTTPSNSGHLSGACAILEKKMKKSLLGLACRHHVMELILSAVFPVLLEPVTSGPTIKLFERFKKDWKNLQHNSFKCKIEKNQISIRDFIYDQLSQNHPRDDYKELLNLSLLYIGENENKNIKINVPGAYHRARWMAKTIYCLKIYLFREQFKLSSKELKNLEIFNDFVVEVYLKAWFCCPNPITAPKNDLQLLKTILLYKNKNKVVGSAALKTFSRHLWYLNEYLVGLAFFDDELSIATKSLMVSALKHRKGKTTAKRVNINESDIMSKEIPDFVTQNTKYFFDTLGINREFLNIDPSKWETNEHYMYGLNIAKNLKVVNDCAERGIALIQSFNQCITHDEAQKQYLLQAVEDHRVNVPNSNKSTVLKYLDPKN